MDGQWVKSSSRQYRLLTGEITMKLTALICFIQIAGIGAFADTSDQSYASSLQAYIDSRPNSDLTSSRRKSLEDLLNSNPVIAESAIKRPEIQSDHKALAIALMYPARNIRILAAEGLSHSGTSDDLPAILAAFDYLESHPMIVGGSMGLNSQRHLHDALIASMAYIVKYPKSTNTLLDHSAEMQIVKEARRYK